jgi:hypothetical protein
MGTVYGHTGSFPGYGLFAAASADGRRSVVFTVNAQIVPRSGAPEPAVSALIRRVQALDACHASAVAPPEDRPRPCRPKTPGVGSSGKFDREVAATHG